MLTRVGGKLYSKDTVFKGHLSGKTHQQAQETANKLRKDIITHNLFLFFSLDFYLLFSFILVPFEFGSVSSVSGGW